MVCTKTILQVSVKYKLKVDVGMLITLSLPRVMINFNFLFQSLTRDIPHSMENLAIDSLLR